MANRLTKIYTRTGDDGSTGMADGSRIVKDDLLIQAIGDVDELNSQLAVLVCHAPDEFNETICRIQNELFNVGAELSMGQAMIEQSHVVTLENSLDTLNKNLTPLKEFILPGGGLAASHCHVARAVCRRVERSLVSLNNQKKLNENLMAYVNRLSDYLFVLARAISKSVGEDETYWQSARVQK
ncbi:ATP:Cob(I)alamin adenosyltransferase [hydrothermal vent metagenome]|uniref:ATP:Cob(I)alamin adenosyltransferase n=1 Tax=hydrothermal vent metagenome TaxID=652676 RepID=A0A3B0WEB7_9ZZZZ